MKITELPCVHDWPGLTCGQFASICRHRKSHRFLQHWTSSSLSAYSSTSFLHLHRKLDPFYIIIMTTIIIIHNSKCHGVRQRSCPPCVHPSHSEDTSLHLTGYHLTLQHLSLYHKARQHLATPPVSVSSLAGKYYTPHSLTVSGQQNPFVCILGKSATKYVCKFWNQIENWKLNPVLIFQSSGQKHSQS